MADIDKVDGLDVRAGMKLRRGDTLVHVEGAARRKGNGGAIVNVVTVRRLDNGQRGTITLREGQSFTVAR